MRTTHPHTTFRHCVAIPVPLLARGPSRDGRAGRASYVAPETTTSENCFQGQGTAQSAVLKSAPCSVHLPYHKDVGGTGVADACRNTHSRGRDHQNDLCRRAARSATFSCRLVHGHRQRRKGTPRATNLRLSRRGASANSRSAANPKSENSSRTNQKSLN